MADSLTAAVASGERLVGTVLTLPDVATAELLSEPFDLVWIDLEHGALDRRDAQEMIIGAQAGGAFGLVRLPATAGALITAALDGGADGIVIADVREPDAVEALVSALAHPPEGTRGWGPRRLGSRHRSDPPPPWKPSLWLQVESRTAVERIEQIAAVPGIDVICIGTADLSFALGSPLRMDDGELLDAVRTVRAAAAQNGVAFALAGPLDSCPAALLEGTQVLVHSTDAKLCAAAVDAASGWLREAIGINGKDEPSS